MRSTHDHEDRVRYWLTSDTASDNQYLTRSSWAWIDRNHGDEHVKKNFSTAVIDNEDMFSNLIYVNMKLIYVNMELICVNTQLISPLPVKPRGGGL